MDYTTYVLQIKFFGFIAHIKKIIKIKVDYWREQEIPQHRSFKSKKSDHLQIWLAEASILPVKFSSSLFWAIFIWFFSKK